MGKERDRFRSDNSGAATTDYVMLAAALIAMSLSGLQAIRAGAFDGIRNILEVVDDTGCATTDSVGTTDLTDCN